MVYHYNEMVSGLRKSKEFNNLVNKSGHSMLVLN